VNSAHLLPAIRDLYSRRPEYLDGEAEIAAAVEVVCVIQRVENVHKLPGLAVEVARGDDPQWKAA